MCPGRESWRFLGWASYHYWTGRLEGEVNFVTEPWKRRWMTNMTAALPHGEEKKKSSRCIPRLGGKREVVPECSSTLPIFLPVLLPLRFLHFGREQQGEVDFSSSEAVAIEPPHLQPCQWQTVALYLEFPRGPVLPLSSFLTMRIALCPARNEEDDR